MTDKSLSIINVFYYSVESYLQNVWYDIKMLTDRFLDKLTSDLDSAF